MYGAAIGALSRCGRWQEALGMLDELAECELEPNAAVYGAAVHSCKRHGRWQESLQLLADAEERALTSVRICSEVINVCGQAAQWPEACAALGLKRQAPRLQRHGLQADAVAHSSAIAACARGFAWPAALHLLQSNEAEAGHTAAISACEKGREWRLALQIFGAMPAARIATTTVSCSAAISACEKGQAWEEALSLAEDADMIGLSAAMSACTRALHWQKALQLFSNMKQPDLPACGAAAFACQQGTCWQGTLELLCPDRAAYSAGITSCAQSLEWERATELWAEFLRTGIQPQMLDYAAMAFAHGTARQWQRVVELQVQVRRLGWLPSGMYASIIRGLGGALHWEKALALLPELKSLGPEPDAVALGSLAVEAARSWQWRHVLALMDTTTDSLTRSTLLSSCSHTQHLAQALPYLYKRRSVRLSACAGLAAQGVAVRANAAAWRMLRDLQKIASAPEWQQRSQDAEPLVSLEGRDAAGAKHVNALR
ncbi:unnamed protein product [Effrenium voratum]|uniref:Pentatricopeptide repeat-containing protein, chloroplastic n=1 Tax=Effrenium voratum TaxID=2562239 RepID=A0AA36MPN4_9DINO|nr:unnamed protein product [Effrenium voratum]